MKKCNIKKQKKSFVDDEPDAVVVVVVVLDHLLDLELSSRSRGAAAAAAASSEGDKGIIIIVVVVNLSFYFSSSLLLLPRPLARRQRRRRKRGDAEWGPSSSSSNDEPRLRSLPVPGSVPCGRRQIRIPATSAAVPPEERLAEGVGEPPRLCRADPGHGRQRLSRRPQHPARGAERRSQGQDVGLVDSSDARESGVQPRQVVFPTSSLDDVGGLRLKGAEEFQIARRLGGRERADEREPTAESGDVDVEQGRFRVVDVDKSQQDLEARAAVVAVRFSAAGRGGGGSVCSSSSSSREGERVEAAREKREKRRRTGKEGRKREGSRRRLDYPRGRVSLSRGPCHRSVAVALDVQGFDSKGGAVSGTRHVGLYPFAMSD